MFTPTHSGRLQARFLGRSPDASQRARTWGDDWVAPGDGDPAGASAGHIGGVRESESEDTGPRTEPT